MGVLIIFSIATFICIAYVILEPSEKLKQQLYFFGKFPKGTKIDHSPTKCSVVIVTYPSDETGTEVWEFDRVSKKAKMTTLKKGEVILWQDLELEEALNRFVPDRRNSTLLFRLLKRALMYYGLYLFLFGATIFVIAKILLIKVSGEYSFEQYLPINIFWTLLSFITIIPVAYLCLRIYKASKKHKKIRVKIA